MAAAGRELFRIAAVNQDKGQSQTGGPDFAVLDKTDFSVDYGKN